MQANTGEWLGRQRSAAGRELKTEALWGLFFWGGGVGGGGEIKYRRKGRQTETRH